MATEGHFSPAARFFSSGMIAIRQLTLTIYSGERQTLVIKPVDLMSPPDTKGSAGFLPWGRQFAG